MGEPNTMGDNRESNGKITERFSMNRNEILAQLFEQIFLLTLNVMSFILLNRLT